MVPTYILSLDQGTTSSRALLLNSKAEVVGMEQKELTQYYPRPGWVEHDPVEIWETQIGVAEALIRRMEIQPGQIAAIGITNQRETAILWDRSTGKPVYRAIVWQDNRTAGLCERLNRSGKGGFIREKTGLVTDSYFSATKIRWILDHVDGIREKAEKGEILFGTVDSWLIWNLTRGERFVTDVSNASRTLLFNIRELDWDPALLELFTVPPGMLPGIVSSSEVIGRTHPSLFKGAGIPIAGVAGDQQAALFGQLAHESGMAKNTYGTGCFMLMNTGNEPVLSHSGLVSTIAWKLDGRVTYALEGSVFIAGAAVQWLRDGLRIIGSVTDSETMARGVEDSGGIYVIPAFSGLGAPYWDMRARGAILGLTQGITARHIVRATLESMAYQTRDILDAMKKDSGIGLQMLHVDGGAVVNDLLMQFQADILGTAVQRPVHIETTAMGAAFLAGLAVRMWSPDEISRYRKIDKTFYPRMNEEKREELYRGWQKAVNRTLHWVDE